MIRIALITILLLPIAASAQDATVKFHEPRTEVADIVLPVDPVQRIQIQHVGQMAFGLVYENRIMMCCGAGAIRTTFKIDDRIVMPLGQFRPGVNNNGGAPLPPDRAGKPRVGSQSTFASDGVQITQWLELIPSKPAAAAKRQMDTVLIRYLFENKSDKPRKIGTRVRIDTMINNNDGALFAAPTRPGEILDATELSGKTLPEYVQILERPDLKDPGFVGHFTLKLPGNRIGPDRFLCTAHGGGDNGWEAGLNQANGDSDCVLYWSPREIKPGQKIEMAYAYGKGLASLPDSEGRVRIALGGSFEPGKLFTIQAVVEDPFNGQTLSLELPEGMSLVEGGPIQPVAAPDEKLATGMVLWKGRVDRLGEFSVKIRSSNGITETRTITVSRKD